jgi:F-type H+-transporting ATPase subunit b
MGDVLAQFGIDLTVFVWEVINFLVVLTILYFLVFRTLGRILDKRQATIREGVENAEKAEEMLVAAEQEKQQLLREAQMEASDAIAASVVTAKTRESEIIADAQKKGQTVMDDARQKGEEQKQEIIASSREDIAKMVVLGAEKVLAKK